MTAPPLVYIIGDSISVQYGLFLEKHLAGSWRYDRKRGEAEALLNLDNPQGANGGDSSMVLSFLSGMLMDEGFRPDLLLLNCGLHDIKTDPKTNVIQMPAAEFAENLRKIIALVATHRIPMAWIRITHCVDAIHNSRNSTFHRFAADHAAYNEIADKIMADARIPVIDLCGFTRSLGADPELFCDHVHFHAAVQERQAAYLAGWLAAYRERAKLR